MKYYRYLLITLLLLSANAQAFQPKIEIIEQFDNLKMIAFIDMEDIHSNPEWNPDLGAPPLTIIGAIQAVKKFSKQSGAIKEIELRQVTMHEKKWHYLVKVDNESMQSKYSVFVVLMNGTVIPAIIQPQGYK